MKKINILFLNLISFLILPFVFSSCKEEEPANPADIIEEIVETAMTVDPEIIDISEFVIEEEISKLITDCEIYDMLNDRIWKYNVLLPPDFSEEKTYPVLYLLHGKGGHYNNWRIDLGIQKIVDYYYLQGMKDLVIVMPDAGDTYYVDGYLDDIKYESFFHGIFRPYIEQAYHIENNRDSRYIGGLSMGGYGALRYALTMKQDFSFCYAMSTPADGKGDERTASMIKYLFMLNPTELPFLILDIGKSDQFLSVNLEAHSVMNLLSVRHEFIYREGGHDVIFWKSGLILLFNRLMQLY